MTRPLQVLGALVLLTGAERSAWVLWSLRSAASVGQPEGQQAAVSAAIYHLAVVGLVSLPIGLGLGYWLARTQVWTRSFCLVVACVSVQLLLGDLWHALIPADELRRRFGELAFGPTMTALCFLPVLCIALLDRPVATVRSWAIASTASVLAAGAVTFLFWGG